MQNQNRDHCYGQTLGGTYSAPTVHGPAPPQPLESSTLVADTARSLISRAAHIHGLIDRIARVTDRVFGCEPVAGGMDKPQEPQHDVDRLNGAMRCLDLAVERMEHQTRRVEQV